MGPENGTDRPYPGLASPISWRYGIFFGIGHSRMDVTLGHLHVRLVDDRWSVQWVSSHSGAYQYFPNRERAIEWATDRLRSKAVHSATVHEPDGKSWAL